MIAFTANCLLHCFSSVPGKRERRRGRGPVIVWGETSVRGRVSAFLRLSGSSCCLLMIKSFPSFLTQKHTCAPNTCSSGESGMESTLHKIKENKRRRVFLSVFQTRPRMTLCSQGRRKTSWLLLQASLRLIPSCPSVSLFHSLTHSLWYMTSVYVKLHFSGSRVAAGHTSPVFYSGLCKIRNSTIDSLSIHML